MCYNEHIQDSKKRSGRIAYATDDLKQLCNNILKIDPKIRFVAIWHDNELLYKSREGLITFLNEAETLQSVMGAIIRWMTRRHPGKILGVPNLH